MAEEVIVMAKDFQVGTRIADAVTAHGNRVIFPENAGSLDRELTDQTSLVIIDLEEDTNDPLKIVRYIRRKFPEVPVVGFRAQVRKRAYSAARDAGCSWVLSKTSLVKNLPTLLGQKGRDKGQETRHK